MKLLLTGASGFVGGFVQQVLPCTPLALDGGIIDLRNATAVNAAENKKTDSKHKFDAPDSKFVRVTFLENDQGGWASQFAG